MRARVIAVGTRLPAWARSACSEYLKRMTGTLPVALLEIEAAPRSGNTAASRAVAAEGKRILRALGRGEFLVALDERGREFSTRELSGWLANRMEQGSDLAFVIGGADGLSEEVLGRAGMKLALSRLTLPHALARVLLCEQLYRAHGILANHPYHRD